MRNFEVVLCEPNKENKHNWIAIDSVKIRDSLFGRVLEMTSSIGFIKNIDVKKTLSNKGIIATHDWEFCQLSIGGYLFKSKFEEFDYIHVMENEIVWLEGEREIHTIGVNPIKTMYLNLTDAQYENIFTKEFSTKYAMMGKLFDKKPVDEIIYFIYDCEAAMNILNKINPKTVADYELWRFLLVREYV